MHDLTYTLQDLPRKLLAAVLTVSLGWALSGCLPTPTSDGTLQPTVISVTPTPGPQPSGSTVTPKPTLPAHQELIPVETYGAFATGHTLELPDGIWLDAEQAGRISGVSDLTVRASGDGRAILTRNGADRAILTLKACDTVVFQQVRFGYDQPDWPDQTEPGSVPLIELVDCVNVRFEDCAFFGSAGDALRLNGSEGVVLDNCTFYNNAGAPLATGDSWLASQVSASDCLFESIGSGMLPLNLTASTFTRCEWVGRQGYLVPLAAANSQQAQDRLQRALRTTLVGQLGHILATRVASFADSDQAIRIQDNLFASQEVFSLFDELEQNLPGILPPSTLSWSLSGEKAEETEPGASLDPTLGLRVSLKAEIAPPPTPAPTVTGGVSPTVSPTDAPAPERLYDIGRLLEALQPFKELAGQLDPLITGSVDFDLFDQFGAGLLSLSIPVDQLASWIDRSRPDTMLVEGRLLVQNPDLVPADFCLRETCGIITARGQQTLLTAALAGEPAQQIVYPDGEACLIEHQLGYEGTTLSETSAWHRFTFGVERKTADGLPEWTPVATLESESVAGAIWLTLDGKADRLPCQVPDETQRDRVLSLLQEPLLVMEAGQELSLQMLSAWLEEPALALPLLVLSDDQTRMTVLTVLYDDACRPRAVTLELVLADDTWTIGAAELQKGS
ncbi:MAG: right-handed parallel beta-helix repeat-containing protein [Eubacteriales bacterium]|nr:right-handed parallel beta-helix repeat-containing protein [Eubacteriales bacterium]